MAMDLHDIPQFFNGKSVFLTGFSGYLGRAIAEKILRSCPGTRNIFVLIRSKKGVDPATRLEQLVACPLFDHLRLLKDETDTENKTEGEKCPLQKLVAIPGDLSMPNLGISEEDVALLCSQVSIVIHSAATVKFEEPLKLSMKQNVEGTKKVLELAEQMANLQSFVYVSTAYSNCERKSIDEIVYPTSINPEDAIQLADVLSDDTLDYIGPKLLETKPNTYTFTKHLAEKLVEDFYTTHKLPVCIVRPSIVAPTNKDPFPGWVDNYQGTSGVFAAMGLGYLRSARVVGHCRADFIPLDHVVSLIISAAWATAADSKSSSDFISVYNSCSGADNPLTWNKAGQVLNKAVWKFPFKNMIWYPDYHNFTQSALLNAIYQTLFHRIPGTLGDFIHSASSSWHNTFNKNRGPDFDPIQKQNSNSKLVPASDLKSQSKSQSKTQLRSKIGHVFANIQAATRAVEYFVTHDWEFSTRNTRQLLFKLSPADRQTFDFDICAVKWDEFMVNYIVGLQKYTLKEKDWEAGAENHAKAINRRQKRMQRFHLLHRGFQLLGFLALIFFIMRIFQIELESIPLSWPSSLSLNETLPSG